MNKSLWFFCAVFGVSQTAHAQSNASFVVGADLARSHHQLELEGLEQTPSASDDSFSLSGYFVINPNMGLGVRYTNFGSILFLDTVGGLMLAVKSIALTAVAATNLAPSAGEWALGAELGAAKLNMDIGVAAGQEIVAGSVSDHTVTGKAFINYGINDFLSAEMSYSFVTASFANLNDHIDRVAIGLNLAF